MSPCPFCGNPSFEITVEGHQFAKCSGGGCGARGPLYLWDELFSRILKGARLGNEIESQSMDRDAILAHMADMESSLQNCCDLILKLYGHDKPGGLEFFLSMEYPSGNEKGAGQNVLRQAVRLLEVAKQIEAPSSASSSP